MKKFKKTDVVVSTVLILFFLTACLVNYDRSGYFELLLTGYFVVGGWQVISMLVHIAYRKSLPMSATRIMYQVISLIALVTMPLGSFWLLAVASPFMAVFYAGLCFKEVREMNTRPLAILK
ncbi:MAG: hypothetical protein WBO30_00105 [Ferruginibacter sp.]